MNTRLEELGGSSNRLIAFFRPTEGNSALQTSEDRFKSESLSNAPFEFTIK
ncbi:hypothetical protein [Coxiella-like endosymbiont of Rhipicephalus sanguineus]|uniref:hypothetical protein n=1 Tax=Coxiella-like endosymbiont of Rhipicephalus sanguineus TaxID=1955402 RepID=UPI00203F2CCB|nr:hypothetical protein [Coxiella-like endosymbiont of Rhipicephalus sanguineus]